MRGVRRLASSPPSQLTGAGISDLASSASAMNHIDPEALTATNTLHDMAREWIEHLRTVLYHARVLTKEPLPDEHPLSEDFPFVRSVVSHTFARFRTRTHFDSRPMLGPGEEVSYPVLLEYHPGSPEYNAFWRITSGAPHSLCPGRLLTSL